MKLKAVIIILLLLCIIGGGCATSEFDNNLNDIVKPYRFNYVSWELGAFAHETRQWLGGEDIEDPSETVREYFSLVGQIRVLEWQIATDETGDTA
ncbi:MAG: hypothetical protein PVJ08_04520, partial [Dehalococcoidia bacterium]